MSKSSLRVLAVGATGSIGRPVVEEALRQGHSVRALVRDPRRARLPSEVELVSGDLTDPASLTAAVDGIDAIVFTHGTHGGTGPVETVDYAGVRNILLALGARKPHIALMTAIGVTDRKGAHDWKRRGERLVRASGSPYTIVRPGWFDYNDPDQHRLVLLQGDTRQSGTPRDGVIARRQLAQILVHSLGSKHADRKTFELVAERGPAQDDLNAVFATVTADPSEALDGAKDAANMPLDREPKSVRADLEAVREATVA